MKYVKIEMCSGTRHCQKIPDAFEGKEYSDFEWLKWAARELDIDLEEVKGFEVTEKELARKRVCATVTVDLELTLPEDVDAEALIKDSAFTDFEPYISQAVEAKLAFERDDLEDQIEVEQFSITEVEIDSETDA